MKRRSFLSVGVAHVKWWGWFTLTKVFLGVVYISVIADGLRMLVPALAQKIHQLPMLSDLKSFEGTHKLDLAPFMAFFMALGVWYLWERILIFWLGGDFEEEQDNWDSENEGALVLYLGFVILGADILLFYVAMTYSGWGDSQFSFAALLATIAYVGVLIFVSYVSIRLGRDISILKKGEPSHA